MKYKLKYGKHEVEFDIDKNKVISVLELKDSNFHPVKDIKEEFLSSIEQPLGIESSLKDYIIKIDPQSIIVVLEDITRANPYYPEILQTLVSYIPEKYLKCIKFLIATGTHRGHSKQENIKLYGEDLVSKFEFINHNCDDIDSLEYIGTTSFGNKIYINRLATTADLVILTGSIDPHSFAGYSGTRKAVLPGIAGRESITFNHSFVVSPDSIMGEMEKNKINLDMLEASEFFVKKVNTFVINFIKNDRKQLIKILAGNLNNVYYEGIKIAKELFAVPVEKLSDVTIVSCGGYPRDINLYQAQKSLTCASMVTKIGGVIILVAECVEGIGQEIFGEWLMKKSVDEILSTPQEKIVVEGHRAYLTAKILKNHICILISSMDKNLVEQTKFVYFPEIQSAIRFVEEKFNGNYRCNIIPNGSSVLPILY